MVHSTGTRVSCCRCVAVPDARHLRRLAVLRRRHDHPGDLSGIALHPEILKALSPTYALGFLTVHCELHHRQPLLQRVPGTAVFLNRTATT